MSRAITCCLVLILSACFAAPSAAEPSASLQYKRLVTREARLVFGLSAPVAMLAGQIEQESGWRSDVCSAYACGLTQFTKATADEIDAKYLLGGPNRSNPEWAVRAQMAYMRDLYEAEAIRLDADTDCDRWAFTLSSYNGGYGWVKRDKAICAAHDCDTGKWFGNVEDWSNRAAWAFRENRGYPRRILGRNQYIYETWGKVVTCPPLTF